MTRRDPRPAGCGRQPSAATAQQTGFSLLEVLVAIVLLSFGVLGVVGLQAASLQANKEARLQSSAVRLGRELGDLMRGNKDVAMATDEVDNPYLVDFTGTLPAAVQDCMTAACTSAINVAHFEVREWLQRLGDELPGVRAVVCFDRTPYDADGGPQWDCTDDGGVAVVKIGWTRASTDRSIEQQGDDSGMMRATAPSIVLPVIAGSTS